MAEVDLNIKYKGIFLNSFDNNYETTKVATINTFLEKESINNKTEAWNKLDKTGKIKLLNNYVDSLITVNNLSATDVAELKHYLTDSLDKKKLQHVKDVVCDKATGKILSIPTCLLYTSPSPRDRTRSRMPSSA